MFLFFIGSIDSVISSSSISLSLSFLDRQGEEERGEEEEMKIEENSLLLICLYVVFVYRGLFRPTRL